MPANWAARTGYTPPQRQFVGRTQNPNLGAGWGAMPIYATKPSTVSGPSQYDVTGKPNVHGKIAQQEKPPSLWDSMFGSGGAGGGGGMAINPGQFTQGISPTDLSGARAQINPRMLPGVPMSASTQGFVTQQASDQSRQDREAGDLDLARRAGYEGGRLNLAGQVAQSDSSLRMGELFRRLQELNFNNADFGSGLLFSSLGSSLAG